MEEKHSLRGHLTRSDPAERGYPLLPPNHRPRHGMMKLHRSPLRPLPLLLLVIPLACSDQPTSPQVGFIDEPPIRAASVLDALAPSLYAHSSGNIVAITPAAAIVDLIGPTGYLPLESLATGPDGALYATHADPRRARTLVRIDEATGTGVDVGTLQHHMGGLAFSTAGVLYGLTGSGEIYTLDTATAAATLVASLTFKGWVMDVAFGPDGALYAAVFDAGGPGPDGFVPGTGDQLLRIDLADPTEFTTMLAGEARGILGIEFDAGGTLWGANCQAIQRIDPSTGHIGPQVNLPGAGPADCYSDLAPGPGTTGTLQVMIDVRPGSTENPINRASRGVVPVAILGATDFDVADVESATVVFAGAAAIPRRGGFDDVNGDGLPDRVFHFDTRALVLAHGAAEGCLTGSTAAGTAIEGCDEIAILR